MTRSCVGWIEPLAACVVALFLAGCLGLGDDLPAKSLVAERSPAPDATATAYAPAAETSPGLTTPEVPQPGAVPSVRAAVARSLPYIERHGVAWIEKHGCVSCHQVPVLVWSHNQAAAQGFAVDREKLDEWNRFTVAQSLGKERDNTDGIQQLILGRVSGAVTDDELAALAGVLAAAQRADGSWRAGGQLPGQRRSKPETHRVSSLWMTLALDSAGAEDETLTRAREFLGEPAAEGESTKLLVASLLAADRFGEPEHARELLTRLLAEQRGDGGWGWLRGEETDAFATGQSLYALAQLRRAAADPAIDLAIERASRFLVETQREDGSWPQRSTLREEHGETDASAYWGTGWAAIGLLHSLPG